MIQRLAIALCIALPVGSAWAGNSDSGRHVVIVLEASRHMAGSLGTAAAPGEPRWTRLGAAREAVGSVLKSLAGQEQHSVTLVLFGHRVAEQQRDGESVSVPQQEYLRLTDGKFEKLSPEQDVEIVRESRPLTGEDLAGYQATLSALKPWGQSPLMLAIERAVELSPVESSARQTQIVVLTSGRSEQADAQPTLEQLLETIHGHRAAVSIVQLGAAEAGQSLADLRDIAVESGGELYQPKTTRDVAEAVLDAASRQEPRRIETSLRPEPITALFQEQPPASPAPAATAPADETDEQVYDIVFDVTYYGAPVKEAEVIIRGDNFDLIYDRELEYKKPDLRAKRVAGRYLFKDVPLGGYTMEITANVKNRTYQVIRGFSADDDNKAPGRSFKIQLEKSKDQPPPPPPAAP